jgi:hypothetical protein
MPPVIVTWLFRETVVEGAAVFFAFGEVTKCGKQAKYRGEGGAALKVRPVQVLRFTRKPNRGLSLPVVSEN